MGLECFRIIYFTQSRRGARIAIWSISQRVLAVVGVALDIRDITGLILRFLQWFGIASMATAVYSWLGSFISLIPPLSLWLFGIWVFALSIGLVPRIPSRLLRLTHTRTSDADREVEA
jgi:hypothetical protein